MKIPRIVNANDEQALEVALRLRDAGVDCRINALTIGPEASLAMLRRAIATGADDCVLIDDPETAGRYARKLGTGRVMEVGGVRCG